MILTAFFSILVDSTRSRKKSTDNNRINSSTSSDDDKGTSSVVTSPFAFDSLQKLAQQKDIHDTRASIELDEIYPSIDKTVQMIKNDEDDDELLLAVAAATCTNLQTK